MPVINSSQLPFTESVVRDLENFTNDQKRGNKMRVDAGIRSDYRFWLHNPNDKPTGGAENQKS